MKTMAYSAGILITATGCEIRRFAYAYRVK
jgi:hypothetical protein